MKMFQANRQAKQVLIRKEGVKEYPCQYCGASLYPYANECMDCGSHVKWKEFSDYVKAMAKSVVNNKDKYSLDLVESGKITKATYYNYHDKNGNPRFCKDCGTQITRNNSTGYCLDCLKKDPTRRPFYKHKKQLLEKRNKKIKRRRYNVTSWTDVETLPHSAKKEYSEHRECRICGNPITNRSARGLCANCGIKHRKDAVNNPNKTSNKHYDKYSLNKYKKGKITKSTYHNYHDNEGNPSFCKNCGTQITIGSLSGLCKRCSLKTASNKNKTQNLDKVKEKPQKKKIITQKKELHIVEKFPADYNKLKIENELLWQEVLRLRSKL